MILTEYGLHFARQPDGWRCVEHPELVNALARLVTRGGQWATNAQMASIPVWEPNPSDPLDSKSNRHHLVEQASRNSQSAVFAANRIVGIDCEVSDPDRIGDRATVKNNTDDSKWLDTLVTCEETLRLAGWNNDRDPVSVLGNRGCACLRNGGENTFPPERLHWIEEEERLDLRSPVPRDGRAKHYWTAVHQLLFINGNSILSMALDRLPYWLGAEE